MKSDIVNRLRTNRECFAPCLMDDAADEIVRLERVVLDLIAERDEARRLCCERAAMDESGYVKHGTMLHFAESRGWDCFGQEDGK